MFAAILITPKIYVNSEQSVVSSRTKINTMNGQEESHLKSSTVIESNLNNLHRSLYDVQDCINCIIDGWNDCSLYCESIAQSATSPPIEKNNAKDEFSMAEETEDKKTSEKLSAIVFVNKASRRGPASMSASLFVVATLMPAFLFVVDDWIIG